MLLLVGVRLHHTQRLLQQFQGLSEIQELAGTVSDKELYDAALARAVAMTDSQVGFFHVISEDQQDVILTTWNAAALTNCKIPELKHYPIEQAGIWVDCVRAQAPTVVNDFKSAPGRKGLPDGHFPLYRFMSVPVIDQGRVKIIFGVGNKRRPYRSADVQRLNLVASKLLRLIEKRRIEQELRDSLLHIQTLHGLIPICAWCKKLRDDGGYWDSVENYLSTRTDATFTHGICPECKEKALASDS